MSEILLCVKNVGGDTRPKQGDVVWVAANGWAWGTGELGQVNHPTYPKHNQFRVIKFPNANLTAAQTRAIMAYEQPADPLHPSPYLQYRGRFLDKTKIPAGILSDYLLDDLRTQPFLTLNYTVAQLNTIVTTTDDVNCPAYHKRIAFP